MIIGSHNSWSYLPPKKWWMKLIRFSARCQDLNIVKQYELGVRCFDLRIRFDENNRPVVAHGIIEYNIDESELIQSLEWLNRKKDVVIRILHEVRTRKQYTQESVKSFINYCSKLQCRFDKIKFWCGKNLYDWREDFNFSYKPTCEEKYASVCKPKIIDDWYPRLFAKRNNREIIEEGTNKDILLIDFVNYGN